MRTIGNSLGSELVNTTCETTVITPNVFSEARAGLWFVLHTRPQQEKILADTLNAMEVGCYLPLLRQVRYHGKRRVTVEMPLFPGYLFLRGSLEEAYEADRTRRVVQVIRVVDQAQIHWELENLFMAVSRNAPLHPYAYLKLGTLVEVRSGPFKGIQGIVAGMAGKCRLAMQVRTLNQAVSLEIDGSLLDVVGSSGD